MFLVGLAATISEKLLCHTLRFDFSGNGHSEGAWKFCDYNGDYQDLCSIIDFVRDLGCEIAFVVGHSQGSFSVLKHASHFESIPLYVNLAGRFVRKNEFDPSNVFSTEQISELNSKGSFIAVHRGQRVFKITKGDIINRCASDISETVSRIEAKVLTIHGGQDETVNVRNAHYFAETIKNHVIHIIPEANHNFNGFRFVDEVVDKIKEVMIYLY